MPAAVVAARAVPGPKQILFGDLHVHTTFSADAFQRSLPMLQGDGAHPPADACDVARFCAALDFWALTDHAESLTPRHWVESREAVRQCNAVAGAAAGSPDLVAFLGWEWTQVGGTPAEHFGHKNVIFRDTEPERVPRRPVAARAGADTRPGRWVQLAWRRVQMSLLDFPNRQRYLDWYRFQEEIADVPRCPAGVDTRALPADCQEVAETPEELFEKLAQWGFPVLVIPHGTTWGRYTPPGTTLEGQLTAARHAPDVQRLFEVYSGHGSAEVDRAWRAAVPGPDGEPSCPAPTPDYEPCCWRAGEIMRARCGAAPPAECERRVVEARAAYVAAGVDGRLTVPGAAVEDWRDCGQCRDCFLPAYQYRPEGSVQATLARTRAEADGTVRAWRFGLVGSSDNHRGRPGAGYKEVARLHMTDATGFRDPAWRRRLLGDEPPAPTARRLDPAARPRGFRARDFERGASFFVTGGLAAVHADGRDRDAVWAALERREVYATSGERILLWFELLNGPAGPLPMGAETRLATTPRFRARALGAFRQRPGCPQWARAGLAPERLERLCRGECYNPGDVRHRIARIEVVRIRPGPRDDDGVRVDDPWRRFPCLDAPGGCAVEFDDPEFAGSGREAVYYVRAVQEPTPAVNGGGLRCERDADGTCVTVHPCWGDWRTPPDDDCLAPVEERAWSSPIFVAP